MGRKPLWRKVWGRILSPMAALGLAACGAVGLHDPFARPPTESQVSSRQGLAGLETKRSLGQGGGGVASLSPQGTAEVTQPSKSLHQQPLASKSIASLHLGDGVWNPNACTDRCNEQLLANPSLGTAILVEIVVAEATTVESLELAQTCGLTQDSHFVRLATLEGEALAEIPTLVNGDQRLEGLNLGPGRYHLILGSRAAAEDIFIQAIYVNYRGSHVRLSRLP